MDGEIHFFASWFQFLAGDFLFFAGSNRDFGSWTPRIFLRKSTFIVMKLQLPWWKSPKNNSCHPKFIWVCLKMSCTPKLPNGFADHKIPFLNGYFIGKINPIFRHTHKPWKITIFLWFYSRITHPYKQIQWFPWHFHMAFPWRPAGKASSARRRTASWATARRAAARRAARRCRTRQGQR